MYFLLILIITYLLYRFLIRRLRWRVLRFAIGIPLMIVFVLGFSIVWGVMTADARTQDTDAVTVLDDALVQQGDLQVTISSTGQIQPNRQVALAFAGSGLVTDVYVEEGQTVQARDLIAKLDSADLDRLIDQATIALGLQEAVYNALTSPPSEYDIAVAQAALDAARAQYNAAASTAPTAYQEEIARLQTEIARNRLWQAQLSRDSITVPDPIPNIDVTDTGNDNVDDVVDGINAAISAQSSAQIAAAQAQLRQAESSLEQFDYGVAIADTNYESTLNRGADFGSVNSALAGITQAEIALENLINGPDAIQLELANIDLENSRYAIELAEYNRSQSELYAPFDGVLVQNNFVIGQTPPQGIGAILIDDSIFYVDMPVDEVDIVNVQVGQRVTLRVDALPDQELGGEVVQVAYTPTRLGQLVVYNVRIQVDATSAPIRAGMSVTGDIIVQDKSDVVYVPNRFIRIDRITLDAFVTVELADGSYEERLVLLGARNDSDSEILAGVDAGERVVLLPQSSSTSSVLREQMTNN